MGKQVGLITENSIAIPAYIQQLDSIFGQAIRVSAYSIDDGTAYHDKNEKVFLTSAISSREFSDVKNTMPKDSVVIPFNLCLRKKPMLQLKAYAKGTKALLYNVTRHMAEETIAQIYQSGINNIEFTPFYPGLAYHGDIKLIVNPGEVLSDDTREVVDIGSRMIDIATVIELAVQIDCEYILETKRFDEYYEQQFSLSSGISLILTKNKLLAQQLTSLVQLNSAGLIGIDANHKVFECNHAAASYLGSQRSVILGAEARAVIPEVLLERCKAQQVPVRDEIIGGRQGKLRITLTPVARGLQYLGAFISLEPCGEAEKMKTTAQAYRKGHSTRYHFTDITGISAEICKTIDLAKMMAKTDSSVLITGESGTGKELFAHSIHNSSRRSEGPFVAINCAAIPDNLLESELFGYEEGAFTGAKKGGKPGLFELANTGSIFLDEIEGMGPNLQIKLLRVIQEREIMRVGGDERLPIDVRIISASNRNLRQMTQEGKFRSDLYYRINTLPIHLPPLRRRRDDIAALTEEFKSILNLTFVLTKDAESRLKHYDWPGNIRELRNCVEYLGCLNLPVIDSSDLPAELVPALHKTDTDAPDEYDLEAEILSVLLRKPCGRKLLAEELRNRGFSVNETQLRKRLTQLKQSGWITSGSGRGGSAVTGAGKQELAQRNSRNRPPA